MNLLAQVLVYQRLVEALSNSLLSIIKSKKNLNIPDFTLIGSGKQGEVYDLGKNVLKIQVAYDENDAISKMRELQKIKNLNLDLYPKIEKIFNFGNVENSNIGIKDGFAYGYIMEKLVPLKDSNMISKIINLKLRKRPVTQFENETCFKQAIELYQKIKNSNTTHVDVNPENIMKNKNNVIKLIDLDSVIVH